jgi:DNA-binding HxlR family transcriptional regulator
VISERLRRWLDYELIPRREIPGRVTPVEYARPPMGRRLSQIIRQLRDLDEEHAGRTAGGEVRE